jgi:hypothetical protein
MSPRTRKTVIMFAFFLFGMAGCLVIQQTW